MNNHILVIGAGGFVGQHLVRALLNHGEKVIAVCRRLPDVDMGNAEVIVTDLAEPEQLNGMLERSRAVVHLASRSAPGSSAGKPLNEIQNNLTPLLVLLQTMQQHPSIPLLYLSSGGSLYSMNADAMATEASTVGPRSYHGAAKVAAEYFISAWCSQFNGRATLLRPSNIYGPGQIARNGFGIVPTCFEKIARNQTIPVWGDGSVVRDYLYIDDFIQLCTSILGTRMPTGARIVNAGSGAGTSLNQLFDAMEAVTGRTLQREYTAGRTVDAHRVIMDISRAGDLFGWSPSTSLDEGLRATWQWFTTTLQ